MPNYNAQNPPYSIAPHDAAFAFGVQSPAAIAASPGGLSRSANVVTVTTSTAHGFFAGQTVVIAGSASVGGTFFDGTFIIATVPSATTFTYAQAAGDTGGGGTAVSLAGEAPATGQASQQFALPSYAGFPENGRTIRWQLSYNTAPTSISVVLQAAITDADANYATIDTSTATAGEGRSVSGVRARFLRAKISSIAGGAGVVVQVLA